MSRNRFKSFEVCMGYCKGVVDDKAEDASKSEDKIDNQNIGPKPDNVPPSNLDENINEPGQEYDEYDPSRCTVGI